jgi:Glycosyl transferase family 2/Methyltransferase domain
LNQRPLFSILHPSARPDKWRAVYDDWMAKCVDPSQVEYVLCVDERWDFHLTDISLYGDGARFRTVWNHGRRCYVDSVNTAAKAATGQILIVIADDQFACEEWDRRLGVWVAAGGRGADWTQYDFVIQVSTGTPDEDVRHIIVMPIVSRARYERLGYLFYPDYESMFADNDLCEHAEKDGVIIDAKHLMFPHRHAMVKDGKFIAGFVLDKAYQAQMRPEAFQLGAQILDAREQNEFTTVAKSAILPFKDALKNIEDRRKATGWGKKVAPEPASAKCWKCSKELPGRQVIDADFLCDACSSLPSKILAICYPGERFSAEWVTGIINLTTELPKHGWALQFFPQYTTNVYTTRMALCEMVLNESPTPSHVLWIDDDNIGTAEQVLQLATDLEEHPDVDVMAAWCWIHHPQSQALLVSCGTWAEDGSHLRHYNGPVWMKETKVHKIDWTGFPFVLMRREALVQAGGSKAFLPIIDEALKSGLAGEDTSWCKRAGAAGVIMAADPRVRVHHQKLLAVEPAMPGEKEGASVEQKPDERKIIPLGGQHSAISSRVPRIAGMLRVKNEARWIKRVIESIKPLCDAGVWVLDDASTDETIPIMRRIGGVRIFERADLPATTLDEARDKNWLMKRIVADASPDWILCIDGDEELEAGGVEKIREALRDTDKWSFSLKIPYLWNSPDTWRVDGIYRDITRHSLFRPRELRFDTLYGTYEKGVHAGLHVGNSPSCWEMKPEEQGTLDVRILHYGYMLKEDRLNKFYWYNEIDPDNEIEDSYRHIVIGDVMPAASKTKFAGPLQLEKLPQVAKLTPEDGDALVQGMLKAFSAPTIDTFYRKQVAEQPTRLNLGCSDRLEPGYLNVDICQPCDLEADLREVWRFPDSSVDEIRAWDIIEHLPDAIHTMNEAFRVLKSGGVFDIIVPTTDGRGAFQDPTHKSFWNRNSFFYFEAGNPHLHRFEKAYGMRCAFRIAAWDESAHADGVTKLHIVLEAVKESALANAAD